MNSARACGKRGIAPRRFFIFLLIICIFLSSSACGESGAAELQPELFAAAMEVNDAIPSDVCIIPQAKHMRSGTMTKLAVSKGIHDIPEIVLNSGYAMPVIGLGTWTLSNEQAEASVYAALKCGMRLIDTARYYRCEAGVGKGVRRAIGEGIVTRGEVFITSKIMPSDYHRAAQGINDSLADMGVDYIDLMLIHQPGENDEAVYKAMEDAVHTGKIRSIGISNYYTREQVDEVLSYAKIIPAVIQNENHLFYQNRELQEYVKKYGIAVESWYPFGGRDHVHEQFGNEAVAAIAEAHGKSPAQVILRWHVQAGYIAIPGSANPKHIAENFGIFDFSLTEKEMQSIYALDRQKRHENW